MTVGGRRSARGGPHGAGCGRHGRKAVGGRRVRARPSRGEGTQSAVGDPAVRVARRGRGGASAPQSLVQGAQVTPGAQRLDVPRPGGGLLGQRLGAHHATELQRGLAAPHQVRDPVAGTFGRVQAQSAVEPAVNALPDGGDDALRAEVDLRTAMHRLPAAKRLRPGPDVASRMVHHSESYSDEELTQDLIVLTVAGHQPTADWIGDTLRLMLTDDRFAVSLRGGRRSVGQAMNEVLWEDAPFQNFAGRFATRDVRLGDQLVNSGDLIVLGLAAADTDPAVRPDTRDLPEGNQAHLAFSHGEHRCPHPAREIAEAIARAGVEVLLDRLPDVRLTVPPDGLAWRPSPWLRGLTALPVEFTPVPAVAG